VLNRVPPVSTTFGDGWQRSTIYTVGTYWGK